MLTRRVKSLLSISSGAVGLNPRLDAACSMTNAAMESISLAEVDQAGIPQLVAAGRRGELTGRAAVFMRSGLSNLDVYCCHCV